ncbi:MAG: 50S ribosomal protein L25 [Candidatus Omnitrophica bacterium]|nr:50S ribosomal protein L25 [Candidatus Omnitrophota bacterium]
MQKTIKLKAIKREQTGKQYAKKLRLAKTIPAIVYGQGMSPIPLEVNGKELETVLRSGENVIVNLQIEGDPNVKEKTVLVSEVQVNPVNDHISHVDFHTISLTEKLRVKVPIHEKGEAAGLKEGGVIDHVHREIEVECLPTDIPSRIDVNIDTLKIGDAIYVKDIVLPAGVKCTLDPEEKILSILAPMAEEVAAPTEGEVVAEPELIKKERKEKEGEEKAPAAGGAPKAEKEEKK